MPDYVGSAPVNVLVFIGVRLLKWELYVLATPCVLPHSKFRIFVEGEIPWME